MSDLRHTSVQDLPLGCCHSLTLYETPIFGLLDCNCIFFLIIRIAFVYILEIGVRFVASLDWFSLFGSEDYVIQSVMHLKGKTCIKKQQIYGLTDVFFFFFCD